MRSERREFARSLTASDHVLAAYHAGSQGRPTDPFNHAVRLVNVSRWGLCMVTVGRLRKGILLAIDLHFPRACRRVRVRGRVRWSTTVESKERLGRTVHMAGIQFARPVDALGRQVDCVASWRPGPPGPASNRNHKRFVPGRVEVTAFPRGFWQALGFRSNVAHRLKDLSLGGVQILTERRLVPGRRISLRMNIGWPRASVMAEGVVRWCRRDTLTLEPRWHVGIVFRKLSARHDERLRAVARHYLK